VSTTRNPNAKDGWRTPEIVLEAVRRVGPICLDPSAGPHGVGAVNLTGGGAWIDDGLKQSWAGAGLVFCNPPYSANRAWCAKAAAEASRGAEIVLLVPASLGARWFQDQLLGAQALCVWKGRLRFIDPDTGQATASAMFDSALVYFGHRPGAFQAAFEPHGMVVKLNEARRAA
jgi:phage N-6-adenine-methyltransferase